MSFVMLSPLSDISASDVSSWVGFFLSLSFPMMKRLYDSSSVLSAHRGAQQGKLLVSGFLPQVLEIHRRYTRTSKKLYDWSVKPPPSRNGKVVKKTL